MWRTPPCLTPLTSYSLFSPLQSGFCPTIPLKWLQPRSLTTFSAIFSSHFSVPYLPYWQHLTIVFLLSFLKTPLALASDTISCLQHLTTRSSPTYCPRFWLPYLSFSAGSSFYSSLKCYSLQFSFYFSPAPWSISFIFMGSSVSKMDGANL